MFSGTDQNLCWVKMWCFHFLSSSLGLKFPPSLYCWCKRTWLGNMDWELGVLIPLVLNNDLHETFWNALRCDVFTSPSFFKPRLGLWNDGWRLKHAELQCWKGLGAFLLLILCVEPTWGNMSKLVSLDAFFFIGEFHSILKLLTKSSTEMGLNWG